MLWECPADAGRTPAIAVAGLGLPACSIEDCDFATQYGRSLKVQKRLTASIVVIVTVLAFSSAMLAQTAQSSGAAKTQTAKAQAFDLHDLNGIWSMTPRKQLSITNTRPPLTTWGQAKFGKVRGSFANAALGIKAFPEKVLNDPLYQ